MGGPRDPTTSGTPPECGPWDLADALPFPVWIATANGFCTHVNRALVAVTGAAPSALDGLGWLEYVAADEREYALDEWTRAVRERTPWDTRMHLARADGASTAFDVHGTPVADAAGAVTHWVIACLPAAAHGTGPGAGVGTGTGDDARAWHRNDAFVAALLHQLRNPLAPIRNALHLLRHGNGTPPDQALAMLDRQVHALTRLVDNLSELSRLTGGHPRLRKEPVAFDALVRRTIDAVAREEPAPRHAIVFDAPPVPVRVAGEAPRLEQVVLQLLRNAVRFSPAGGRIDVRLTAEEGSAVLRVRDDGVGLAAEMLPLVFEPFVGATREHPAEGLGIGLTLVRGTVELHGGTVTAHSAGPGCGSEFVVRLALLVPRDEAAPAFGPAFAPAEPSAPRGARVLVVEDNVDAALSLALLLEGEGYEVRTARDAEAALELVPAFVPAIVLCDIGLPQMDGYALARRLRERDDTAHAFLVALTGFGDEEHRARALDAGFDRHLVKPVDPAALSELLALSRR